MKRVVCCFLFVITSLNGLAGVKLSFKHCFEQEQLVLNTQSYEFGKDQKVSFSVLKYYIGNIVFHYASGKKYSDKTIYHLIDLTDAGSLSWNYNNIPEGKVVKISFGIGVDSTSNAEGLMDGDLDPLKGMYWAWSSGFINFKLEGKIEGQSNDEFKFHIGGFLNPNQSYQNTSLRLNVPLKDKVESIEIGVDLSSLFKEVDIQATPQILSPSLKSKAFSEELPKVFKVLE